MVAYLTAKGFIAKDAKPGQMYKYSILGANGTQQHCDPYGFGMELRPASASIIRRRDGFAFADEAWMCGMDKRYDRPMNIYEIHPGSWRAKKEYDWKTAHVFITDKGREKCQGIDESLLKLKREYCEILGEEKAVELTQKIWNTCEALSK